MPLEPVSGTELQYYLISFDADGNERQESDGTLLSKRIISTIQENEFSDVFVFSHGWNGDVPAARDQYQRWIKAMVSVESDISLLKKQQPNFNPLLIGLHWPSLPWGDESLEGSGSGEAMEGLVECYASRISRTKKAKNALRTIFSEGMEDLEPLELSPTLIKAYQTLNLESELEAVGPAGAPGKNRNPFEPELIYQESIVEEELLGDMESYGLLDDIGSIFSRVFAPLRSLSYWHMKERARRIGESAGFSLLKNMLEVSTEQTRFHLMGHSFGCIIVSAALGGPGNSGLLPKPVNSLSLVQGALSLWSYCAEIPVNRDSQGYFYPVIRDKKVAGPIITTHSDSDTAVGTMYPLASGVVLSNVDFTVGHLPVYGAIGAFGIQGDGISKNNISMKSLRENYDFKSGEIYNLEASQFIVPPDNAAPLTGSHNAIDNREVAHAVWSAAFKCK